MSERICLKASNPVEHKELWAYLLLFMKKCPVDMRMWTITEEPLWPATDEEEGIDNV